MGIFSAILNKLRGHRTESLEAPSMPAAAQAPAAQPQAQQPTQASAPSGMQGSAQPAIQDVDIEAVLAEMAAKKGGGGNYRQSIVDLLKLLDLDSSLGARKELAQELNVNAGAHGSAEQNIALHRAVMQKIEENGGKVPESMRS